MYPATLTVIPLEDKVLLPGVVMRLVLSGPEAIELTRRFFKKTEQQVIYVVCVPLHPLRSNDIADCTSQAPQVPLPQQAMTSGYDKEQQRPDQQQPQTLVTPLQLARLASFGCLAKLVRVQRSGVGIFGVYMEGIQRCELVAPVTTAPATTSSTSSLIFQVRYNQETVGDSIATGIMDAYMKLSKEFVQQMRQLQMPDSLIVQLTKMTNTLAPLALADLMISIIETSFDEKWNMLATVDPTKRITLASNLMQRQLQVLHISQHVHSTIEGKLTKQQREFYLRQQVCYKKEIQIVNVNFFTDIIHHVYPTARCHTPRTWA